MRLVFVLYAEDRDLLPSRTDGRAQKIYETGYRTEPPLSDDLFLPDESEETAEDGKRKRRSGPLSNGCAHRGSKRSASPCRMAAASAVVVPESAAPQRAGGG